MCSIGAHYIENPTLNDDASSGGGRQMPSYSKKCVLVSLGIALKFVDIWFKSVKENYLC